MARKTSLRRADIEAECRKLSTFIEKMGVYKESFKENARVMKLGIAELDKVIPGNGSRKMELLSIMNEMADTVEKNAGRLQDAQEKFLLIMKNELGCR